MNRLLYLAAAAVVVFLCACGEVVSLSSLVTPEKAVRDEGLAGRWRRVPGPQEEPNPAEAAFILAEAEGAYEFRPEEQEKDPGIAIRLRLAELDGRRYAEMFYARGGDERIANAMATGLQVHRIFRYSREGDRFTLQALDFERFKKLIEEGSPGIAFLRMENGNIVDRFTPDEPGKPRMQQIVLTEPSERLQQWLVEHAADEDLWQPESVFERLPAEGKEEAKP